MGYNVIAMCEIPEITSDFPPGSTNDPFLVTFHAILVNTNGGGVTKTQ